MTEQELKTAIEEHRKKDILCCPESCFCWDMEAFFLGKGVRSTK